MSNSIIVMKKDITVEDDIFGQKRDINSQAFLIVAMIATLAVGTFILRLNQTKKVLIVLPIPAIEKNSDTVSEPPPIPEVEIEVNIPATELTLFEGGSPLFRRSVAIGQGVYPTPVQESLIKRIEWNPWWFPPPNSAWAKGETPKAPGPGNPLGLVKMPLSDEILFHGTNKDSSVGHPASHGCMRMHNRDVTELAWYLQQRFSEKKDPALRELYAKNRTTTYRVELATPVPVRLIYRPVLVRNDFITFYPDHYQRVTGKRKAAIITEILRAGYDIEALDDEVLERLADTWPVGNKVQISELLRKRSMSYISEASICE